MNIRVENLSDKIKKRLLEYDHEIGSIKRLGYFDIYRNEKYKYLRVNKTHVAVIELYKDEKAPEYKTISDIEKEQFDKVIKEIVKDIKHIMIKENK